MNHRKKRPHEVRLPRRKPQLKRQYSSNTSQILYKQIVAAEELRRVTEEAEDAKKVIEKPAVVLFEKLNALFEACNTADVNVNHGADMVIIINRIDKETNVESTQQIYCHRAIVAISPILGELTFTQLANKKPGKDDDGILKVVVPDFGLSEEEYHICIKLLYTGFFLFAYERRNNKPKLSNKTWIETKDGAKVIAEDLYVNAFLNGSVKHYKKVNARRIYWTGKEKTLAREHLDKHFGICNAYVRADDGGGNGIQVEYYATSPFAMMWDYVIGDELKTTVWKDQKNEERKRSFLSKMADKFFTSKKK